MFTGPHTEGPCGNPRKALAFLAQLKLGPRMRAGVLARPASTRCPGAQGVVQGNTISAGWWWRWRRRGRWEGRIWRRRTLCIIQAGLQRRVGLALTPECTKVKDLGGGGGGVGSAVCPFAI